MIRIASPRRRPPYLLWGTVALSLALHTGFYTAVPALTAKKAERRPYKIAVALKPLPPPAPEPPPPEERPKPLDKRKSAKVERPVETQPPPPPNQTPPPPKPDDKPPPPTFGLNLESFADSGTPTGASFRAGNTLGTNQGEFKPLADARPLPSAPPAERVGGLPDAPVQQSRLDRPLKVLERVEPEFTEEARQNEIEGLISLRLIIDEAGKVVKVEVKQGLGYGLDEEAVRAVKRWRFEPPTIDGKAVRTFYNLKVRFELTY